MENDKSNCLNPKRRKKQLTREERVDYLQRSNRFTEAIAKVNFLSLREVKVLLAVHRKTLLYNKDEDFLAASQIAEMTGIDKRHIKQILRTLIERKMVFRGKDKLKVRWGYVHSYGLQEDSTKWLRGAVGSTPKDRSEGCPSEVLRGAVQSAQGVPQLRPPQSKHKVKDKGSNADPLGIKNPCIAKANQPAEQLAKDNLNAGIDTSPNPPVAPPPLPSPDRSETTEGDTRDSQQYPNGQMPRPKKRHASPSCDADIRPPWQRLADSKAEAQAAAMDYCPEFKSKQCEDFNFGGCLGCTRQDPLRVKDRYEHIKRYGGCKGIQDDPNNNRIYCSWIQSSSDLTDENMMILAVHEAVHEICLECPDWKYFTKKQIHHCGKVDLEARKIQIRQQYEQRFSESKESRESKEASEPTKPTEPRPKSVGDLEAERFEALPDDEKILENLTEVLRVELCIEVSDEELIQARNQLLQLGYNNDLFFEISERVVSESDNENIKIASLSEFMDFFPKVEPIKVISFEELLGEPDESEPLGAKV